MIVRGVVVGVEVCVAIVRIHRSVVSTQNTIRTMCIVGIFHSQCSMCMCGMHVSRMTSVSVMLRWVVVVRLFFRIQRTLDRMRSFVFTVLCVDSRVLVLIHRTQVISIMCTQGSSVARMRVKQVYTVTM